MTELIHETVRAVDLAGDTTAMTSTGTATISVSDGQVWLDRPTGTGRSPATTSPRRLDSPAGVCVAGDVGALQPRRE